jgi:hypothetical protein
MSICMNDVAFRELSQPIYVGSRRIGKVMVGSEKVYPDITEYRARYAQWIMFPPLVTDYGPHLIDQYGAMLQVNSVATITKCSFLLYLNSEGYLSFRKIGARGKNISLIRYVPFLAYQGKLIYDGNTNDRIRVYNLAKNSKGYYASGKIDANLTTDDKQRLSNFSIDFDEENVRLAYTELEFDSFLSS